MASRRKRATRRRRKRASRGIDDGSGRTNKKEGITTSGTVAAETIQERVERGGWHEGADRQTGLQASDERREGTCASGAMSGARWRATAGRGV